MQQLLYFCKSEQKSKATIRPMVERINTDPLIRAIVGLPIAREAKDANNDV